MSHNTAAVLALLMLLAIATPGCGPRRYAYAPVTITSADTSAGAAADYPFPPDLPQGNVRLATMGIAESTAESPRSIHVRMVVTNRSREPWVVDKSEQRLAVADGHAATIVLANAPAAPSSRVDVLPGQTATIELFFPLPAGAHDAADVPAFDALWTVRPGARVFTIRTPFERFLASSPAQSVPAAGYPYSSGTTVP